MVPTPPGLAQGALALAEQPTRRFRLPHVALCAPARRCLQLSCDHRREDSSTQDSAVPARGARTQALGGPLLGEATGWHCSVQHEPTACPQSPQSGWLSVGRMTRTYRKAMSSQRWRPAHDAMHPPENRMLTRSCGSFLGLVQQQGHDDRRPQTKNRCFTCVARTPGGGQPLHLAHRNPCPHC